MSWIIYHALAKLRDARDKQELELATAVADNDPLTLVKLLKQGIDPNLRIVGQNQEPLIFLAFEKIQFTLPFYKVGDLPKTSYKITAKSECLHLLLKYGADPNLRDSQGRTALEIAILWCLPQTVKLLLLNGADPNLLDRSGRTPLIQSVVLGIQDGRAIEHKLEIMMHLLDSGAEIDALSAAGKTALMYAVGNARQEIVELLVSNGASLTITDRAGNTARDIIERGSTQQQRERLQTILSQPQVNVGRYKYRQFIPEGDRLLATIIQREQQGDDRAFKDLPRDFYN